MRKALLMGAMAICATTSLSLGPANACIVLTLLLRTPVIGGGFDYTYDATMSQEMPLSAAGSPTAFTLYDFGHASLVSATGELSTDWTFTTGGTQPPALGTATTNSAALADIRVTYTGPSLPGSEPQPSDLGTFTLHTAYTGPFAVYVNQSTQLANLGPGGAANFSPGSVLTPSAVTSAIAAPEPATLALFGLPLLSLAALRRQRRQ